MNLKEIFFLLLAAIVSISAKRDRVRLKDVDTLTLYSDRWTTSRRSSPVKQLNCVGGHCNRVQIETAQCYNRGFDGNDVQWECKAELPSNYKFGRLEVSCEGYDYPDDDNILVGSCGLEYTIAEVSKTSDSYFPSSFPTYNNKNGDSGSTFLTILFVGGAAALFFYLRSSRTREQRGNSNGPRSSFNPSAPPPPGFRPDFYGSSDTSYGSSSTGTSHNSGTSDGPGFFSGMATGGILGYLFGSNRNNGYSRRDYQQSSYYSPPTSGYSSFGSLNRGSSGASTSTSTSTGYASTKRR